MASEGMYFDKRVLRPRAAIVQYCYASLAEWCGGIYILPCTPEAPYVLVLLYYCKCAIIIRFHTSHDRIYL